MKHKVAVIGTGYVGLVAGTCFAETGNLVTCVDNNLEKIKNIQNGILPIYEPGLSELVTKNVKRQSLGFTTDIAAAIKKNDIIFIAVGTPEGEDGSADLKHVEAVAREISNAINGYKVIVNKSTVPVGTGERVRSIILENQHQEINFDMVSNPEFLKEGSAIKDFLKPDRVVVGSDSEKALEIMEDLYHPFLINGHPIIKMDLKSAEITKYASNAMLATKISFINEIANLCDKIGADVTKVRQGMITDTRIGPHFLYPGIGYGGSCFPKDVKAIIKTAESSQLDFPILKSVDEVNDLQKKTLIGKLINRLGKDFSGKTICLWGLAFKPETDDMREAPANDMIEEILKRNGKINAHDPEAIESTKRIWGDKINYFENQYDATQGADLLILATEWMVYRQVDFEIIKKKLKEPVIFDGRNLWYDAMKKLNFDWYGVGVPPILNASKKG